MKILLCNVAMGNQLDEIFFGSKIEPYEANSMQCQTRTTGTRTTKKLFRDRSTTLFAVKIKFHTFPNKAPNLNKFSDVLMT